MADPLQPTPAPTPSPTPAPTPAPTMAPMPTQAPAPNNAGSLMGLARNNTVTPNDVTFDESRGVAGRINSMTSAGSPLWERARTGAEQGMARRGLGNSSMALQAGEQAVIETALPIAQADANLFQQQSLANQGARNTAALANAQNALTAGTRGTELDAQERMAGQELQERARQTNLSEFNRVALAQMDSDTRTRLAQIEADSRAAVQGNQNVAQAWGTLMDTISRIQTDPNLDPDTKAALINNNLAAFEAFSTFWGRTNNVDVGELLNFRVAPTGPAPTPAPAPGAPNPNDPYPPSDDRGSPGF